MITQRELAQQLGISYSTVSLALSNSDKVNAATREMVQEAARRVGYRPNLNARALKNCRTGMVGVIFPEFSHAYYSELEQKIHPQLQRLGYTGLFFTAANQDDFRKLLEELYSRGVDGLISGISDPVAMNPLCHAGLPMVIYRDPGALPCSSVDVDRFKGGLMAGRHLIGIGHRRLAYLGYSADSLEPRLLGLKGAVAEAGLELPSEFIIDCGAGIENGYAGMKALLRQKCHPQAVFAFNDATAFGAIRAIHESGLSVPDDIAIVGFDGIKEGRFLIPSLTTIAQPCEATAIHLVSLLSDHLSGKECGIRRIVLEPELVIRESCGTSTRSHCITAKS